MLTRAEQRRQRQLEIEKEQRLEDDEALKMTEEQRETLLRSFRSVKFEFYDLDGLSWTDSIKQRLLRKDARATMKKPTFVVLTKADLASFAPEDTIRPSAVRRARAAQQESGSPQRISINLTPGLRYGKRDGSRTRSPVKGLFSVSDTDAPSMRTTSTLNDDQMTIRFEAHSGRDQMSPGSHPSQRTDAGVITSIFRSSVFSPTHGRKRSQTCSVVATPKSSPLLAPVAHFVSP
ncbi:hypothetical protein F5887DRAFT_969897 [Amanita rubescens]|nr:hypothetical protein F5887DRAFT_969897 [Amanita rubescens]